MNRTNRFLVGLVLALGLSHLAFEWTITEEFPMVDDFKYKKEVSDDELLIPITRMQKKEPPQPIVERGPNMKIVEYINKRSDDEHLENPVADEQPADFQFDKEDFGMDDENLAAENHPSPFTKIEVYPHTSFCADLKGKAMEECSKSEIIRLVKERLSTPSILREIGEKQGVLLQFRVNENGQIDEVNVIQQTHPAMARAAVKTLKSLPKLFPAIQNGKAVSMQMKIPIILDFRD